MDAQKGPKGLLLEPKNGLNPAPYRVGALRKVPAFADGATARNTCFAGARRRPAPGAAVACDDPRALFGAVGPRWPRSLARRSNLRCRGGGYPKSVNRSGAERQVSSPDSGPWSCARQNLSHSSSTADRAGPPYPRRGAPTATVVRRRLLAEPPEGGHWHGCEVLYTKSSLAPLERQLDGNVLRTDRDRRYRRSPAVRAPHRHAPSVWKWQFVPAPRS